MISPFCVKIKVRIWFLFKSMFVGLKGQQVSMQSISKWAFCMLLFINYREDLVSEDIFLCAIKQKNLPRRVIMSCIGPIKYSNICSISAQG